MKKLLAVIMVLMISFLLCSCKDGEDGSNNNTKLDNSTQEEAVDNLAHSLRDYDAYVACFQKDVYDALKDRGGIISRKEFKVSGSESGYEDYCNTLEAEILERTTRDDQELNEIKSFLKESFGISADRVTEAVKLRIKLSFTEKEELKTDVENEVFVKVDGEWFWIEIFEDAAGLLQNNNGKIAAYELEPFS